ncbi:hypothetical protein QAD02_021804 [Eretmocerus hayati]|uniref:Uncharacterized protein n=1 Tax=Eretmocerus hayati TaxID=131215 RepID=A0ACC2PSS5_9HYME|nr:hypothetical protein QAD02_021804 [Eretmocerus hayati]
MRLIPAEGFREIEGTEIVELVTDAENLTAEAIEELLRQDLGEEKSPGIESEEELVLSSKNLSEIFKAVNLAVDLVMKLDPIMIRGSKIKHETQRIFAPCEALYRECNRKAEQSRLTGFFKKK